MLRRVRTKTARRFLQLPLAADAVAAARLVPGDRDVHEPLEEVTLSGLSCAPGVLELLVGGEELAAADQFKSALELRRRP